MPGPAFLVNLALRCASRVSVSRRASELRRLTSYIKFHYSYMATKDTRISRGIPRSLVPPKTSPFEAVPGPKTAVGRLARGAERCAPRTRPRDRWPATARMEVMIWLPFRMLAPKPADNVSDGEE